MRDVPEPGRHRRVGRPEPELQRRDRAAPPPAARPRRRPRSRGAGRAGDRTRPGSASSRRRSAMLPGANRAVRATSIAALAVARVASGIAEPRRDQPPALGPAPGPVRRRWQRRLAGRRGSPPRTASTYSSDAQALLQLERRQVLAPPEIVVGQQPDRRFGERGGVGVMEAGDAVDHPLRQSGDRGDHRRHAERLRLGQRQAERLALVAEVEHHPRAAHRRDQLGLRHGPVDPHRGFQRRRGVRRQQRRQPRRPRRLRRASGC